MLDKRTYDFYKLLIQKTLDNITTVKDLYETLLKKCKSCKKSSCNNCNIHELLNRIATEILY